MKCVYLPVVALVMATSPALAQTAAPAAQTAAPAKDDADKKICRSKPQTGSMFAKRECHTKAEWAEISARNERDVDSINSSRSMSSGAQAAGE